MADNNEYPKCSKNTVVQPQEDLYACLNCHQQDGSEPSQLKSNNGVFWTTVIGALLAIFFLQMRDTTHNTQYLKTKSSPEPIAIHSNTQ
ncbi:MAG TPA: hypothetical protein DCE56_43375 [Cyanobacteria bacterium UBA8553]|nr:hypothetical protein [Cyanobacteria bacterium UBA8553]